MMTGRNLCLALDANFPQPEPFLRRVEYWIEEDHRIGHRADRLVFAFFFKPFDQACTYGEVTAS